MFKQLIKDIKRDYQEYKRIMDDESVKYLEYGDKQLVHKMRKLVYDDYFDGNEGLIFDTIMTERNIKSYLAFTNKRIIVVTPLGFIKKSNEVSFYSYDSVVNVQKGRTKKGMTLFAFNITNKFNPQPVKIKVHEKVTYTVLKYLTMNEPPLF